jgi:hypothetical protein
MPSHIIKSELIKLKRTGKLVCFKSESVKEALRRRFKKGTDENEMHLIKDSLPNILLVIGYRTNRNTRTGYTTGELVFLGDDRTYRFHLPPQFCTANEVVESVIEMFFKEATND